MQKTIIGLTGAAGSGKDTVASMLPISFYRYAFAKPLKEALKVLGIPEPKTRAEKEGLLPGRTYSYRKAAQTLGTEWARNLSKTFWSDLAKDAIQGFDKVVLTDVRFENEADWVRNQGGVIWHIKGRMTELLGDTANHPSEIPVEFKLGDVLIQNDGTLDELRYLVLSHIGDKHG